MYPIDLDLLYEFIKESNAIENEHSEQAFQDSLKAWGYGYTAIIHQNGFIGINDILTIHGMVMKNLNPDIAGKWRACSVMVGGRTCPRPFIVPGLMQKWVEGFGKINLNYGIPEREIRTAHIAFEHIHPFVDGNGRVGRLVMNLQRVYNDLPLLIIHTGKKQQEYYGWF